MSSLTERLRKVRESRQNTTTETDPPSPTNPPSDQSSAAIPVSRRDNNTRATHSLDLSTVGGRLLNLGNEIANEVAKRKDLPKIAKIAKRLMPLAVKDLNRMPEEKLAQGIGMLMVAFGRVLYPNEESVTVVLRVVETPVSSNGKTADFGSENLGSNPSAGTNENE